MTKYRYADLANLGVLKKVTRPVEKVLALQKFFGVTSLHTVPDLNRYQPAFHPKFRIGTHKKKEGPFGSRRGMVAHGRIGRRGYSLRGF